MYIQIYTIMKNNQKFLIIRIDLDLKNKYKSFCDENCFNLSKRIKHLIKNDIQNYGK